MGELIILIVIAVGGAAAGLWLIRKGDNEAPVAAPVKNGSFAALREGLSPEAVSAPETPEKKVSPTDTVSPVRKKFSFGFLKKKKKEDVNPISSSVNAKPHHSFFSVFLSMARRKPSGKDAVASVKPVSPLNKQHHAPPPNVASRPSQGTASLRTAPWTNPAKIKETIHPNIPQKKLTEATQSVLKKGSVGGAPAQLRELTEGYRRLERMLEEKNNEIQKLQLSLEAGKNAANEFAKIKVVLEGELASSREKLRDIQNTATQSVEYKQKIAQLENIISQLQKELLSKGIVSSMPLSPIKEEPVGNAEKGGVASKPQIFTFSMDENKAKQVQTEKSLEKNLGINKVEEERLNVSSISSPVVPVSPPEKSVEETKKVNKNIPIRPAEDVLPEGERRDTGLHLRPDVINPDELLPPEKP